MATRTEKGMSIAEFERERLDVALEIFKKCLVFVDNDTKIIGHLERITEVIADQIVRNPEIIIAGAGRRSTGATAVRESGSAAGAADDITGGDDWDNIQRIIDIIKGALGDEKPFIQRIIEKILDL